MCQLTPVANLPRSPLFLLYIAVIGWRYFSLIKVVVVKVVVVVVVVAVAVVVVVVVVVAVVVVVVVLVVVVVVVESPSVSDNPSFIKIGWLCMMAGWYIGQEGENVILCQNSPWVGFPPWQNLRREEIQTGTPGLITVWDCGETSLPGQWKCRYVCLPAAVLL